MNKIEKIAQHFQLEGEFISAKPHGVGHINVTYMVCCEDGQKKKRYLIQKMSKMIFPDLDLMMDNIERVLSYLQQMGQGFRLIKTIDGKNYYEDENGDCYRTYSFIEHAFSHETAGSLEHVYECGRMAAVFQESLLDFPFNKSYCEMTKGFHNTRMRFAEFLEAVQKDVLGRVDGAEDEIAFYMSRKEEMEVLLALVDEGKIGYRATHNDMRVSNFMMDEETHQAVALVDLDTVMPGLAAYDYGDGIRSAAKKVIRENGAIKSVEFDLEVAKAFTNGYVTKAKEFLTRNELDSLIDGILVMSLECGMRYLTDYLKGDLYFAKNKNGENKENAKRERLFVKEVENHIEEMKNYMNSLLNE